MLLALFELSHIRYNITHCCVLGKCMVNARLGSVHIPAASGCGQHKRKLQLMKSSKSLHEHTSICAIAAQEEASICMFPC